MSTDFKPRTYESRYKMARIPGKTKYRQIQKAGQILTEPYDEPDIVFRGGRFTATTQEEADRVESTKQFKDGTYAVVDADKGFAPGLVNLTANAAKRRLQQRQREQVEKPVVRTQRAANPITEPMSPVMIHAGAIDGVAGVVSTPVNQVAQAVGVVEGNAIAPTPAADPNLVNLPGAGDNGTGSENGGGDVVDHSSVTDATEALGLLTSKFGVSLEDLVTKKGNPSPAKITRAAEEKGVRFGELVFTPGGDASE